MTPTRRQRRLIRILKKAPTRTLTIGARVALGYDAGLRVGEIRGFVHGSRPQVEARIEWRDGLTSVIRLDALRPATRKEWRKK